jgi:hypothetical protein
MDTNDQIPTPSSAVPPTAPPPAPPPLWQPPTVPVGEIDAEPPAPARKRGPWLAIAVVAGAVVVIGAVVALGTRSKHTESPAVVFSHAAGRTTGAGSAHYESTVTVTANGQPIPEITMSGDSDFATHASRVSMSAAGQTIEDVRVVGGITYVSSPIVTLPGARSWVSITPADVGTSDSARAQLGQTDPSQGLQFMSAFNGNPQVVGNEKLGGVNVTHYRFTINLKSLMAATAKAGNKLGAPGLSQGLALLGNKVDLAHLPAEAWVDGQGRVRKFTYSLSLSASGVSVTSSESLEFSNFGEPVNVITPAPDDVVPFKQVPDFFSQLSANASSS